ncbi:DNA-directed RNA polymerase II subunit RPB1-like [Hibiscus syriacus]|uniref:DNA-directed RNA polymerase II subunit RPB1-like n=1 Tax=Hibiscus syriacus TaxID=106335 RepID=UPI001923EE22|nr:DNA-directed RNA polymerase II subunit RPB1-like [Hibiscus syriacus]
MPPFSSFLIFSFLCFHLSSIQGSFDSSCFHFILFYVGMITIPFFAIPPWPFSLFYYINTYFFYNIVLTKQDFHYLLPFKHIQDMDFRLVQFLTIFLLHLFLCSGSSISRKPPLREINRRKQSSQESRLLLDPSISTTLLDNVPIVNPTTPGTSPNPTSPSTEPSTNPATPITTPTAPTTNPTTPTTTPTTPTTTPTTQNPTPSTSSGGSWCIANQGASTTALQVALDYACGYGGADCSAIQPGGSCYEPSTVQNHASYAFNDYYQKHPDPTSCVFGGTAQLTNTDPSNGNCHYAASSPTGVTPPASITPPATLPPPDISTMTPPFAMSPPFTGPGGDTVYGSAEPTGLPSSASSMSFSYVLIFATMSLLVAYELGP